MGMAQIREQQLEKAGMECIEDEGEGEGEDEGGMVAIEMTAPRGRKMSSRSANSKAQV